MTYIELFQSIQSGKLEQAYFLWGEEDFLIDEAIKQIIAGIVDQATSDFNLDVLYGSETTGSRIVEIASSFPMIADKRCVVVKELHRLKAADMKALSQYLKKPSARTCLVLTAPKLKLNLSQNKAIQKNAVCVEFKALYDNHIAPWIKRYLKKHGLEISDEAVRILHENVGNSLRELSNELEKVILNQNGRKLVEANDIRNVVGLSRGYSIFELSNAIGMKQFGRSIKIVKRMLESGESPIAIITMIMRHFSILTKVKHGRQLNWAQGKLAKEAGVSPYFLKDYITQSDHFDSEQLQRSFHFLLDADVNLKTSYQSAPMIMELLIYHLTHADTAGLELG
ncbi:DNA polymerase III subunit delta [candidate division KSB1 bacterium]|nr:DNA polymerase III subunit delta [candidate division KSB1 bacterium]